MFIQLLLVAIYFVGLVALIVWDPSDLKRHA